MNVFSINKQLINQFCIFILLVAVELVFTASAMTLKTVTGTGDSPPMNINSLLPIVNNDSLADFQVDQLLFAYAIWVNNDLSIDWGKSLAKSIKFSDKNTVVSIKLKKWRWSNGRIVTANDLVYSLSLIKNYGERYPNYGMGGIPYIIKKTSIVNEHKVVLYLAHSVNPVWFELNGISQLVPLPAFMMKKYSLKYIYDNQTNKYLVRYTDGPYMLSGYKAGRYVSFVRNKEYSGPLVVPNKIIFYMFPSEGAEFWSLKSGVINLGNVPHFLLPAKNLVNKLRSCYTNGGYGINYAPLNFHNKSVSFFHSLAVRKALEVAINQKQIITIAYHGLGVASYSPVPVYPSTFLSPKMKWEDTHPDSVFNIRLADRFLSDSGWVLNSNNIREKNGKLLKFDLMVSSASRTDRIVAELLQASWRKIGVLIHIKLVPFNVELSKLENPNGWQAAIIPWIYSPDYYPSGDGLFNSGGGTNYGGFSNPILDRFIELTAIRPGNEYLYKYQDYAANVLPVLFLPMPKYLVKYDSGFGLKRVNTALSLVHCDG